MARSDLVNVLIVDDDRSMQRMLSDALAKRGFAVTVERDGEWAVQSFGKKQFDVVILDILLPALNGYEVARRIKEHPRGKKVPIIMISGVYKNPVHQKEAVQKHGAFAFLEKPFKLEDLHATMKKALKDRYPKPKASAPRPPPPPVEEDEVTGEFMADEAQREEVKVVEQQARRSETASSSDGPVVRGDFHDRSFAELLAELYRWKASGALLLRRNKVKKIVYFRAGVPELVKSNLLVECLGRVLVRERLISEAECEESLKRMKATGRMQGTVLIEMGCISPHNLNHALQVQLQEKLYDAFRWDDGEYQLNPKVALPPEPLTLGMTAAQLILEGVRRTYDEKRLARALKGLDEKYVHSSHDPLLALQDAGLGQDEQELMGLIDGHKKISTLRALEVLPRADTDRFLYAMKCAQMIELKDDAAAGKAQPNIARLAEAAAKSREMQAVPPPLPPAPQVKPPPLPRKTPGGALPAQAARSTTAPALPWDEGAPRAQVSSGNWGGPPFPAPSAPGKKAPKNVAQPVGSLLPELSEVMSLPKLSSDEGVQREKLAAKVAGMRKLDYFEILGVKRDADRETIKRAYFGLAKEFHPDRHFQSASAEVRQLAQQIYDLVSTAHDTLTDPAERARYVKDLDAGLKKNMNEDVGKILAAEGKFQRGEEYMRQRNFADAHQAFTEAIELYADEGEFHAWLGWSQFQLQPEDTQSAVSSIERAVSLNPKLDKSYLFLGYIFKATGRPDKAERQFEKAIQCNPDCTEALRELRLLGHARR